MKRSNQFKTTLCALLALVALALPIPNNAVAHCDTLDGPVVQDARKAIAAKELTPVLKWIKPQDEKALRAAFQQLLAEQGKDRKGAEEKFFSTLVKIHRAGEGASFTGLKPAGSVEPAVAAADQALANGSSAALIRLVTADVTAGIQARYDHAAETYRHKDESVAQGREFVEAYVEFTHYVERLHQDAVGKGTHGAAEQHEAHKAEHSHH